MDIKIIIDPRIKYNYALWYIVGLEQIFGKKNISFSISPFKCLKVEDKIDYIQGMPFIVEFPENRYSIYIDYHDNSRIINDRYEWCNIYAKVNLLEKDLESYEKLMAIGPSFGIRNSGIIPLLNKGLLNYLKGRKNSSVPFKRFMLDYIYPYWRRSNLSSYNNSYVENKNYVFILSTLWNGVNNKTMINNVRMNFLKACLEVGVELEGGFFYIGAKDKFYKQYQSDFSEFLYYKRLSINEYLNKIKKSFVVFNCPSVEGCLGWKLAEYLMLGKAIISMPINHPMPGPGLKHGVNIHYVQNVDEIKEAILKIRDDDNYRENLKKNARIYYEQFLSPSIVIKRVIERCMAL